MGLTPTHSWKDELVAVKVAGMKFSWERAGGNWSDERMAAWTADFGPGGPLSMESELALCAPAVELLELYGWPREHAHLITCCVGFDNIRALRDSFMTGSEGMNVVEFAATLHALTEAYALAALRAACLPPPPLCYAPLTGTEQSLSTIDPVWLRLTELQVGQSIVSCACAHAPLADYFPDEAGIRTCEIEPFGEGINDYRKRYELVDSDVVAFQSAAADQAGYHALLQDGYAHEDEEDSWGVPFFSTITLTAIHEPGKWSVRGLNPRRRLFTVKVTFA